MMGSFFFPFFKFIFLFVFGVSFTDLATLHSAWHSAERLARRRRRMATDCAKKNRSQMKSKLHIRVTCGSSCQGCAQDLRLVRWMRTIFCKLNFVVFFLNISSKRKEISHDEDLGGGGWVDEWWWWWGGRSCTGQEYLYI